MGVDEPDSDMSPAVVAGVVLRASALYLGVSAFATSVAGLLQVVMQAMHSGVPGGALHSLLGPIYALIPGCIIWYLTPSIVKRFFKVQGDTTLNRREVLEMILLVTFALTIVYQTSQFLLLIVNLGELLIFDGLNQSSVVTHGYFLGLARTVIVACGAYVGAKYRKDLLDALCPIKPTIEKI